MGCADSRLKDNEEELCMATFEKGLHLSRQSAKFADLCFRKYSHDDQLNLNQFIEATTKIRIQRVNTHQFPHIEAFFDQLRLENGNISLKKLLVLSVLLCKGGPHEKAQLLFEIYDDFDAHVLEGLTVKQMIDDLFNISVVLLPTLVAETSKSFDANKVKLYIEKILSRSNKSKDMLRMAFTEGSVRIRREAFVGNLCKEERKQLLSPAGIREFCFKYYVQPTLLQLRTATTLSAPGQSEGQKI